MPSEHIGGESRLARKLGLSDAVVVGLGAMVGSGIFAVLGPAAEAAGAALLWGLGIAAVIAYANATSSAQLAARYPEAGGTYVYASRVLGPFWGYLGGWGFIVGKTASLAAMAMTVGAYAFPERARVLALSAVAVMAAVNYLGVEKTARTTKAIVSFVLVVLAVLVVSALGSETADFGNLGGSSSPEGVLRAAALLFFAFAGYARIATLGEEVVDPRRVIPKAIPVALGIALAIYLLVASSALIAVGADALAGSDAPLATAAASAGPWVGPLVRVGGAVASLGVLISLLAGVSRTALAMARDGNLPRRLAAVHPVHGTPHRAEVVVAAVVIVVVAVSDIPGAIGFSSFSILGYYFLANLSAFRQPDSERKWPRWVQVVGLLGCAALAFSLPPTTVLWGLAAYAAGLVLWLVRRSTSGGPPPR